MSHCETEIDNIDDDSDELCHCECHRMLQDPEFMKNYETWQLSQQRKRPGGVVVCLGPAHCDPDHYLTFQKDRIFVTIGIVPYNKTINYHDAVTTVGTRIWKNMTTERLKPTEPDYDLHTIQAHIKDIDWSFDSFVTIIGKKNGTYSIRQVPAPVTGPPLQCPAWTPLVDERSIEPIYWSTPWFYVGIYNGVKVDVQLTPTPDITMDLESISENTRVLQSMGLGDFVYPILGHVVRNGEVVGLMFESVGIVNRITHEDIGSLCHALTMLQQHHIVHINLQLYSLVRVPSGGIRFLTPQFFRRIDNEERLEIRIDECHWQRVDEIMSEMNQNYSPYPTPNYTSTACHRSYATDIPETPAVPRMLIDSRGMLREIEAFHALFRVAGGVFPANMGLAFLEVDKELFPPQYYFMPMEDRRRYVEENFIIDGWDEMIGSQTRDSVQIISDRDSRISGGMGLLVGVGGGSGKIRRILTKQHRKTQRKKACMKALAKVDQDTPKESESPGYIVMRLRPRETRMQVVDNDHNKKSSEAQYGEVSDIEDHLLVPRSIKQLQHSEARVQSRLLIAQD